MNVNIFLFLQVISQRPSTPFPVNEAAEVHHLIAQPRHHPPYEHD